MPSLDLISAAQSINDSITEKYSVAKANDKIAALIEEEIRVWRSNVRGDIRRNFPFWEEESKLSAWREKMPLEGLNGQLPAFLDDYSRFCSLIGHPFNKHFWGKELQQILQPKKSNKTVKKNSVVTCRLLLNEWQKTLDQTRSEWELRLIEEQRLALLKKLEQLLDLLQELDEQLQQLGLDTGLLIDFSAGRLTEQDIAQLKRWVTYMTQDPGVRQLCYLLGKMRQFEASARLEKATVSCSYESFLPDISSREEIVGIELGRTIEYALPSELALLSDTDTAILFDLKFVEGRLLCFEMSGECLVERTGEREVDREMEEEQQGPMVICIDTSGSMSGMPETIAKAVALFMASKAREKQRPCYLINFSTGIETLDLGESFGMKSLMTFLKKSFHGGTDVAPALRHALGTMKTEGYQKADLLIVSDFIMEALPIDVQKNVRIQREAGNQFYSLVIGGGFLGPSMHTLFDREWVFNPASSSITELLSCQQEIGSRFKGCMQ